MKVLVVGGYDSSNFCLLNLIQEMQNRNIEHKIVCTVPNEDQTRMFFHRGIPFSHWTETTPEELAGYEVVLAGNSVPGHYIKQLRLNNENSRIFVVAHHARAATLSHLCPYADVQFVFGRHIRNLAIYEGFRSEAIAAGSVQHIPYAGTNIKKIVFIEEHDLPMGIKGRTQLATWLVMVAKEFPDYQLVIKPRRISWDIKNGCNRSKYPESIYIHELLKHQDGFSELRNIVIHDEYIELEEVCRDAECIVTAFMGTGSFNAFRNRKGLLLLDGFDCEEHQDHYDDVTELSEYYALSGCRVHYLEAVKFMPAGILPAKEFVEYEVEPINSLNFVIEFMEYYKKNVIIPKLYLPYLALEPSFYQRQISDYLKELTPENNSRRNRMNFLNRELERIYVELYGELTAAFRNYIHRFKNIDWVHENAGALRYELEQCRREFLKTIENGEPLRNIVKMVDDAKGLLSARLQAYLSKEIVNLGSAAMNIVVNSKLLQYHFLFEAYKQKQFAEILRLSQQADYIGAEVAYFSGKVQYDQNNFLEAYNCLGTYLKEVTGALYDYSPVYHQVFIVDALYHVGEILLRHNQLEPAKHYYLQVMQISGGRHQGASQRLESMSIS